MRLSTVHGKVFDEKDQRENSSDELEGVCQLKVVGNRIAMYKFVSTVIVSLLILYRIRYTSISIFVLPKRLPNNKASNRFILNLTTNVRSGISMNFAVPA